LTDILHLGAGLTKLLQKTYRGIVDVIGCEQLAVTSDTEHSKITNRYLAKKAGVGKGNALCVILTPYQVQAARLQLFRVQLA
jgi:hypothetical protein